MDINLRRIQVCAQKIETEADSVRSKTDVNELVVYMDKVVRKAGEIQEVSDTLQDQEQAMKHPPTLDETTLPDRVEELFNVMETMYYEAGFDPHAEGPKVGYHLSNINARTPQVCDELRSSESIEDDRFSEYKCVAEL